MGGGGGSNTEHGTIYIYVIYIYVCVVFAAGYPFGAGLERTDRTTLVWGSLYFDNIIYMAISSGFSRKVHTMFHETHPRWPRAICLNSACSSSGGTPSGTLAIASRPDCVRSLFHTVDGQNPAQNPWNDDSPANTSKQWFQPWFRSGAEWILQPSKVCVALLLFFGVILVAVKHKKRRTRQQTPPIFSLFFETESSEKKTPPHIQSILWKHVREFRKGKTS